MLGGGGAYRMLKHGILKGELLSIGLGLAGAEHVLAGGGGGCWGGFSLSAQLASVVRDNHPLQESQLRLWFTYSGGQTIDNLDLLLLLPDEYGREVELIGRRVTQILLLTCPQLLLLPF